MLSSNFVRRLVRPLFVQPGAHRLPNPEGSLEWHGKRVGGDLPAAGADGRAWIKNDMIAIPIVNDKFRS
ncbi:hypothetical protein D9M68_854940 [compost metagenome]